MTCKALLIDISGKQRYIFNSNKLKLNIGASHIMAYRIFGDVLYESLKNSFEFFRDENLDVWMEAKNFNKYPSPDNKICIGYIGGGNALILFDISLETDKINAFIKNYSKKLLEEFEGLNPTFALVNDFEPDSSDLTIEKKKLNDELNKNKSFFYTNTTPYKHGIEDDCEFTGSAKSSVFKIGGKDEMISKEAKSKFENAKTSQSELTKAFKDILGDNYTFPEDLEDLSPENTKRYAAVVHIDGNGMGQEFLETKTLKELRELSVKITNKLEVSLKKLIEEVKNLFDDDGKMLKGTIQLKKENGKIYLPIRPIINAGDDITFICHGKLGVYLAKSYIKILNNESIGNKPIKSCAGIAIFHTKYPFFRMYELAEQLAGNAKIPARTTKNCYLQFLISSEGKIDNLKQIMKDYPQMKPYIVIENDKKPDTKTEFEILIEKCNTLSEWSKNKVAEHREMLFASDADQEYWKLHLNNRGIETKDPINEFTYDAIELLDFYPIELIK